ncbi:hypothetical protein LJ737_20785 [Hymenobacter sp. 15J16-1T3B]|uniref:hypothetical protein n=1 Tax=Hymenobacter sp. 15J16-1T3B TaxID=2886941 RepID=UPI001D0FB3B4|nr:hypothetical protein [Hymenobacter sp. 15J16-1T3B]MCC3159690.1 hypothetical protein [Hymenobacter sp. 15J16-1T3B]
MTPEQVARARLNALDAFQQERERLIAEMGQELYEALLERIAELLDNPDALRAILLDFARNVHLPFVLRYAEQLLELPALQQTYFEALGVAANYAALRAPMTSTLRQWFGIDAQGGLVERGFLASLVADTAAERELTTFAYQAHFSGMGITDYRAGLKLLITGQPATATTPAVQSVYQRLYARSADTFSQADRLLQAQAAERLGFSAYLYQGGLIASSRPFCKTRNGKVWLAAEIDGWADLKFDGKPDPYDPWTQLGGYNCRHSLNAVPNRIAITLRPELKEDGQGRLYVE